jgi:hypothetical protein
MSDNKYDLRIQCCMTDEKFNGEMKSRFYLLRGMGMKAMVKRFI